MTASPNSGPFPARTARLLCLLLPLVLGWIVGPTEARAHPDIDEGLRLYTEADFGGADEAFERAEAAPRLTRRELAQLIELRALVAFARGHEQVFARRLSQLAQLSPRHRFDDTAPPEVVEAFERAQRENARVTFRPRASYDQGVVRVEAQVEDSTGLVRQLVIYARPEGARAYRRLHSPAAIETDSDLSYYLVALGPGGVEVSSEGTPEAPLIAPALQEPELLEEIDEGGVSAGPILGIGGLTLGIAAAVTGGVLLAKDGDATGETRPGEMEVYTTATPGWVLLGVGAAAIVGGAILLWSGSTSEEVEQVASRAASGTVITW